MIENKTNVPGNTEGAKVPDSPPDEGYSTPTPSRNHSFWKFPGVPKFSFVPLKYRIQKLQALGLENSKSEKPSSPSSSPKKEEDRQAQKDQQELSSLSPKVVDLPAPDSAHAPDVVSAPSLVAQSSPDVVNNPVAFSIASKKLTTPENLPVALPLEPKKQATSAPLAFTVNLQDSSPEGAAAEPVGAVARKLDIGSSLAQWTPKSKRNAKPDQNKKVEEERSVDKPPLGRQRSGTVGAPSAPPAGVPKRPGAGYNSEGYFSSDQDDDSLRRTTDILLTTNKNLRESDVSVDSARQRTRHDQHLRNRPPSPFSPASSYTVPLSETASIIIEKILSTPEAKRKNLPAKAETRSCCKEGDRKPSVSSLTRNPPKKEKTMVSSGEKSAHTVPLPETAAINDEEDKEALSDAGTYTIDKDSPSGEEEIARNDIDEVFGLEPGPGSTPVLGPDVKAFADEWTSAAEGLSATSRCSPNWIQHWAAQVAEQTKPPLDPCHRAASKTSSANAYAEADNRVRRKLPTPPANFKQSRVDAQRHRGRGERRSSDSATRPAACFEWYESGADSDLDTSASNAFPDHALPRSLANKLRLNGYAAPNSGASQCSSSCYNGRDPRLAADVGARDAARRLPSQDFDVYEELDAPDRLSDTSSETSDNYKNSPRSDAKQPQLKFNRAFSLRRARLGIEETSPCPKKKTEVRTSSGGGPPKQSPRKLANGSARPNNPKSNSASKKDAQSGRKQSARSSSTLSSKEVDFENWKRRKSYDPMKAAAEAKKKQMEKKAEVGAGASAGPISRYAQRSPSPSASSLHRSASFHGTDSAASGAQRWTRNNGQPSYPSEDDGPFSFEEEAEVGPHPSPCRRSPLHRSMTSPRQISLPAAKHALNIRNRRSSLGYSEDEQSCIYQVKKTCMEESSMEGGKSPVVASPRGPGSSASGVVGRSKPKMEALDNLVISTIHSLSTKVRTTSQSLVHKLKSQYNETGDRAALLDEVLSHLSEGDLSSSSQSRSTSRELAGILRNLKTIEHALEVIDRVIIVGDDEDDDEMDYVPSEWVDESDY